MVDKIKLDTNFLDEDDEMAPVKKENPINKRIQSEFFGWWENDWQKYNNNDPVQLKQASNSTSNNSDNTNLIKKLLSFIWRNILWFFFWFIILVWAFSWNNDSSSSMDSTSNTNYDSNTNNSSSSSNSDDNIETWEYTCSRYNHDEAWKLQPTTYEKNTVQSLKDEVERIENEGKSVKFAIDIYPLDKYSQTSIDGYNLKINQYNALVKESDTKYAEYESERTKFNEKVNTYNNYLIANCTKR